MGILGSKESATIWDERTFDAHDYALFCSYVHPDAPEAELNLLTDWYLWLFFFDDYFLERFKRSHDMAGAKEYLDRLPAFMPIYPTEIPPDPTNPFERGLAYLWPHTVFTKSVEWRLRFFESTQSQFDASLCELTNINQNRVANPIEYIEMRRIVGAAPWAADLIEHSMSVEVPAEIVTTRPLCVLKDSFADAVHLHNDLFSYQREVEEEGENSNCVLVLERFLSVSPQNAANLTNDLRTSRMHQFEHTAVTELPLLFEEYAIDPVARLNVLLYIKGLQDFQSGSHEWHLRSSRYMNKNANNSSTPSLLLGTPSGLGTAAAHISSIYNTLGFRLKTYAYIPNQPVGQTELPKFYMPFSSVLNPHLESARQHSKQWARQVGMLNSLPNFSDAFIWDEHKFDASDVALCAALIHPHASVFQLNLTADWLVWGTYVDDYFLARYIYTRDMVGAKVFVARLVEFMPTDLSTPIVLTPTNSVERGLANLWRRSTEIMSTDTRSILRCSIEAYTASWLWELANHIQNRIPDPIDYVEMRRKTFGIDTVMVFPQLMQGGEVPPAIYRSQTLREMINAATDYCWMINDIISYQKEIEFEGELHNGVLVIQSFLNCDKVQAVEIVNNLMTARMQQFENLVATELPILFDNFNLNEKARKKLLDYVESLQHWMYGVLQWHIMSNRYKEFELQNEQARSKRLIGIPTGLGTSAARITSLLKTGKTKTATPSMQPKFAGMSPTGLGTSAARIIDLLKAKGS
jgi:germacradienol/geosmin synthase